MRTIASDSTLMHHFVVRALRKKIRKNFTGLRRGDPGSNHHESRRQSWRRFENHPKSPENERDCTFAFVPARCCHRMNRARPLIGKQPHNADCRHDSRNNLKSYPRFKRNLPLKERLVWLVTQTTDCLSESNKPLPVRGACRKAFMLSYAGH